MHSYSNITIFQKRNERTPGDINSDSEHMFKEHHIVDIQMI